MAHTRAAFALCRFFFLIAFDIFNINKCKAQRVFLTKLFYIKAHTLPFKKNATYILNFGAFSFLFLE
jgi:hypothetical protein